MQNLQNEDVGTLRVDHRFNDKWSSYFRFTRNHAFTRVPVALDYGNSSVQRAGERVFELLDMISPPIHQRIAAERQLGSLGLAKRSANLPWRSRPVRWRRRRTLC